MEDDAGEATSKKLFELVKQTYRGVERDLEEKDYNLLQEYLRTKRDNVIEKNVQKEPDQQWARRQTSTSEASAAEPAPADVKPPAKRPKIKISGIEQPIPGHTLYIPVEQNYFGDDNEDLDFVPDLGGDNTDDDKVAKALSDHDLSHRNRLLEYGAECEQDKRNEAIDETLRRVFQATTTSDTFSPERIVSTIAEIMEEDVARIQERYDEVIPWSKNSDDDQLETDSEENNTPREQEKMCSSSTFNMAHHVSTLPCSI